MEVEKDAESASGVLWGLVIVWCLLMAMALYGFVISLKHLGH